MKKLCLIIASLAITGISYAQTNIFPSSGNVGIGTTSPIAPLHIYDGGTNYNNSEILSLQTSYNSNSSQKALTWRDPTAITGQIATYYDGTHVNMSFGHLYNSGYQTNDLMTIMGNGNVGIGTASPSAAFQIVRGGTNPGTDYASMQITSRGSGSIYGPIVYLNGTSGTGGRMWGVVSSGALDASATGAAGNFAIYDGTAGASRLVINSSGNIGIGTTNPIGLLHVYTNSDIYGIFTGDGVNSNLRISGTASGASGYSLLQTFTNGTTAAGVLCMERDGGNVGIGTTTPDAKLAVNGTIHTKEVKVDLSGWPDNVFNKDYQLSSLTEVKNYIDQNHHLPDVPSEQEVIKNGINLGEMNKLLTKKVEELTLYLIDKDKQLTDQQKEINQLKKQQIDNEQQKARIAALEASLAKLTAGK